MTLQEYKELYDKLITRTTSKTYDMYQAFELGRKLSEKRRKELEEQLKPNWIK